MSKAHTLVRKCCVGDTRRVFCSGNLMTNEEKWGNTSLNLLSLQGEFPYYHGLRMRTMSVGGDENTTYYIFVIILTPNRLFFSITNYDVMGVKGRH